MQTVNGKLITKEQGQIDAIQQQTEGIIKRYQNLESQFTAINQQKDAKYLQEVNAVKVYLQKLDKRLNLLEQNVSNQAKNFLYFKIGVAIGLVGLWFWFGMNNQPAHHDTKPKKYTESIQLHHHSN
ncbi:hypothetical protein [Nostoc sp. 'Peltigera membranacea cyanobiont' 232]|uniref:hypothetical protein n=1 Tax=Nostoc sp. 'Peltigera membranacea cyanobiont' 232 TaxID=2014531 RepID=UPI000B956C58|nr:hypothetical protein [Nostoc sp. 'Peltigera membranacea cyanobiont' 232]OYD99976.1 hypothetical protein CDG79_37765 [Nostoc sp. 'Peltigera membranacea cyanobiont' 232]